MEGLTWGKGKLDPFNVRKACFVEKLGKASIAYMERISSY
jgi:hypothetical protein